MERQHWPAQLWLVRHGQSQGNVARDEAHEGGKLVIDLKWRDVDVPLSDLGEQQAAAAGRWFAARPEDERPQVLLSSPYVRARQTADAICKAGGLAGGAKSTVLDERLREREFGVFDGLTTAGIRARYPDEAAHRAKMGKFYHRPPGRDVAQLLEQLPDNQRLPIVHTKLEGLSVAEADHDPASAVQ